MPEIISLSGPSRQLDSLKIIDAYAKLPVQNAERARIFYAEKLELTPYRQYANTFVYEVGGTRLILFPSSGAPSGTHDQLGFVVDDVEAAVVLLRSRGVIFEAWAPPGASMKDGYWERGSRRTACFKDSEGNVITITQFGEESPLRK